MNLARHISVLWRFRALVAALLVVGAILAFLAAFKVGSGGLERRGSETWQAESQILVTQPGFPWARATLPGITNKGADGSVPGATTGNQQQFADPTRFANLAMFYSVISLSDQVRESLPEKPTSEQLTAQPYDLTGNATFLPIIKLGTSAATAQGAVTLNQHAIEGLTKLLTDQQEEGSVPKSERVQLSVIRRPEKPMMIAGRSTTPSILAFMLCAIIALAAAHILEALRPRQGAEHAMGPNLQSVPQIRVPNHARNGDHRTDNVPAPPSASDWSRG
jgi:hypothetical protein